VGYTVFITITNRRGVNNMFKLLKVEKETEPKCWHCGASIKWVCWVENTETGEKLAVGQQCCDNFLSAHFVSKVKDTVKFLKISNEILTTDATDRTKAINISRRIGKKFLMNNYPELYRKIS
jgi:hypothetical protein